MSMYSVLSTTSSSNVIMRLPLGAEQQFLIA